MRISDWSSDVCSSDLSTRLAIGNYRIVQTVHPFFSSKDERQEAAANGSTSLSRNGNRDIIAKLKVRRECPQLPPGHRKARHASMLMHRWAKARRFHWIALKPITSSPCCALRRATSSCCRSEEHTSELQSLMRISYAVFCLKKTKTATSSYPTIT